MKKKHGILAALLCFNLNAFACDMTNKEEVKKNIELLKEIEFKFESKGKRLTSLEKEALENVKTSYIEYFKKQPKQSSVKKSLNENLSEFKENFQQLSHQMDGRENIPNQEIENLFKNEHLKSLYSTPIKSKESKIYILKEIWPSPGCTPTRLSNVDKMLNGKQPFLKGKNPIEFHHSTQRNEDKIYAIPKNFHKENHSLLHNTKKTKSEINRSEFAGIKKKSLKISAVRRLKQWLTEISQPRNVAYKINF